LLFLSIFSEGKSIKKLDIKWNGITFLHPQGAFLIAWCISLGSKNKEISFCIIRYSDV